MRDVFQFMPWRESCRRPRCAESGSSRWISFAGLQGDHCRMSLLAIPQGQSCIVAPPAGASVLVGLRGVQDVRCGDAAFQLRAGGLACAEAGHTYVLENALPDGPAWLGMVEATAPPGNPAGTGDTAHQGFTLDASLRQMDFSLPLAQVWGHVRGSGPYVSPPGLRGHMVLLPLGQASPWHHAPRDLYFLGQEGAVEFAAGGRTCCLSAMDMLTIQAGTPYRYTNVGADDAIFLSIGGTAPPLTRGVYYEEDPGWPLKSATRVMATDADPYSGHHTVR